MAAIGAFFCGYVVTQITGDRMVEKYGGKKLYSVSSAKRSLAERSNGMMMRRQASMDNVLECPVGAKPRPHPLSVTNAERKILFSPNNKMDPLNPSKHGPF